MSAPPSKRKFFKLREAQKRRVLEKATLATKVYLALCSWRKHPSFGIINLEAEKWRVVLMETEKTIRVDFPDKLGTFWFYFVECSKKWLRDERVAEGKLKDHLMGDFRVPQHEGPITMRNLFVYENSMGCEIADSEMLDDIFPAVLHFFQVTLNWEKPFKYTFVIDQEAYITARDTDFFDTARKVERLQLEGEWDSQRRIAKMAKAFKVHTLFYGETCEISPAIRFINLPLDMWHFEAANAFTAFPKNSLYPLDLDVRTVTLRNGDMDIVKYFVNEWCEGKHTKLEMMCVQVPKAKRLPSVILRHKIQLPAGDVREEMYNGDYPHILAQLKKKQDFRNPDGRLAVYGFIPGEDYDSMYLLMYEKDGPIRRYESEYPHAYNCETSDDLRELSEDEFHEVMSWSISLYHPMQSDWDDESDDSETEGEDGEEEEEEEEREGNVDTGSEHNPGDEENVHPDLLN